MFDDGRCWGGQTIQQSLNISANILVGHVLGDWAGLARRVLQIIILRVLIAEGVIRAIEIAIFRYKK